MKFYTEDEMLDKQVGKVGAPHIDHFEDEFNTFLLNVELMQSRI